MLNKLKEYTRKSWLRKKLNFSLRKTLPLLLVVGAVVFHAIYLLPELTAQSPDLNDNPFHYALSVSLNSEIEHGGNPIDHWVPYWSLGFPVFHHYQHLPHLITVLVYRLFFKIFSLFIVYHAFNYLLLVFYPLILYYSLRKMEFSRLAAAGAAFFSLAFSNLNGYGFELGSFTWRGAGMYSQLWAMTSFPLALSSLYVTLHKNKDYFWTVLFLFALANSQLMFGLVAIFTGVIFLFSDLDRQKIIERAKRFGLVAGAFFLTIAYLLLPVIVDSAYHAHSTYDFPEKFDSYGWRYIVTQFLNGNIQDSGRLPVLTWLTIFGLIFGLGRSAFKYRWAAIGFIFWFLFYFGRPTWGSLVDLIPLSSALHLHRLVTMVHFFGSLLCGLALAGILEFSRRRNILILGLGLIVLLAAPVYWERYQYLELNTKWLRENRVAYQREEKDLSAVFSFLKAAPPGRVFPGLRGGWGNNFWVGQTAMFYFLGSEEIPAVSFLPFSWSLAGDFMTHFNESRRSYYDLYNVKYYLTEVGRPFPSFSKEVMRAGRFLIYSVETTGYFDLVDSPAAIYADKLSIWNLMIIWLRSDLMDKKQYLSFFFDRDYHPGYAKTILFQDRWKFWPLLPGEMPAEKKLSAERQPAEIFSVKNYLDQAVPKKIEPAGKVISEAPGKNEFSARILAERDCFLLFKMTFHPGWRAYIDGIESEKIIFSPGLIGVKVSRGQHQVKFIYRAQAWKTPLVWLAFLTAAALFWRDRKYK